MNESSKAVWGAAAALALLISMGFSWRMLSERPISGAGGKWQEPRGLLVAISERPSFAFGFRNFLADVAWLEAVQVAGNPKMTTGDYDRLYVLLNIVGNFDPKFEIPYLLGGLVLGESPDHGGKALQVLARGNAQFPRDWRFPFYMGFTYYFSLGDPVEGGKAIAAGARLPGSPAYLAGLASRMLSEAKEPEIALVLLGQIFGQETDPARRAVLERRIREVTVERDLLALERAVERYRERMGTIPRELPDLVRAGILPGIPAEANGGRYLMEPGGKVRSSRNDQRLRVFQKK